MRSTTELRFLTEPIGIEPTTSRSKGEVTFSSTPASIKTFVKIIWDEIDKRCELSLDMPKHILGNRTLDTLV